MDGISHTAEVTASTLYEAVAAAVEISREFGQLLANSQPQLASAILSAVGLNFGTRVISPMSTWFVGRSIPEAMLATAATIFAFDALIKNPDRRVDNPNI
jgi:type III secretion system FlhB-like substrate exporter